MISECLRLFADTFTVLLNMEISRAIIAVQIVAIVIILITDMPSAITGGKR